MQIKTVWRLLFVVTIIDTIIVNDITNSYPFYLAYSDF